MWLYRSSMKLEQNRKAIEGKILVSFLWDHWQVQDGIRTTKTRPPWKISRSPICFLYLSNSRLKLGTVVGLVLGSSLYPAAQLSMSVWRFPPWKRCRAFFHHKVILPSEHPVRLCGLWPWMNNHSSLCKPAFLRALQDIYRPACQDCFRVIKGKVQQFSISVTWSCLFHMEAPYSISHFKAN